MSIYVWLMFFFVFSIGVSYMFINQVGHESFIRLGIVSILNVIVFGFLYIGSLL